MASVAKDAFWQIFGRLISAVGGFVVLKLMVPYLGPLRYGDYSTILKYFAIRSALADFGLYVVALKQLSEIKTDGDESKLQIYYSKFVTSRFFCAFVVYSLALLVALCIPAYTSNPYIVNGLILGAAFSASFMGAGIMQLPQQIKQKMYHVTFSLLLARAVQIGLLILIVFLIPADGSIMTVSQFITVISTVVASGLTQWLYVRWTGRKLIAFSWIFDREFTKQQIKRQRKYGLAYYLSSFHTLIVLILLGMFYPTIQGFIFVGLWGVALSLLEIFLIVPSALGNAVLQKVGAATDDIKKKHFGTAITFISMLGIWIIVNFTLFSKEIILLIADERYLSTAMQIGSNTILPFLGIVLLLSFIKQKFNYIFVAHDIQRKLLKINIIGVLIGVSIGIPMIYYFNIIGGIITQMILEILFVGGAIWTAYINKLLPIIERKNIVVTIFVSIGTYAIGYILYAEIGNSLGLYTRFILIALVVNGIFALTLKNRLIQNLRNLN